MRIFYRKFVFILFPKFSIIKISFNYNLQNKMNDIVFILFPISSIKCNKNNKDKLLSNLCDYV